MRSIVFSLIFFVIAIIIGRLLDFSMIEILIFGGIGFLAGYIGSFIFRDK